MNRFKRVLLCTPHFPGRYGWPSAPYPATGYLSEFLTAHNIENDVIDLRLGKSIEDLKKKIAEFKPDLIGFSVMSYRRDMAYKYINAIKSPDYKIVIGGAHASTVGAEVFKESIADFVIKGEGEFPLLELCNGNKLNEIKGLICKENGKIIENENRKFIYKLDDIPFPRYEKFELDKYARREIYIVSSRGCPQKCIFCPIKVCAGNVWRSRSAKNLFEELKYWYDRGYKDFKFSDDNFTLDRNRVMEICDLIEKSGMKIRLMCQNGIRADRVDREMLKRMKEVGFTTVCIGVESASNKVLKTIQKGETLETIENAIKTSCEVGLDVGLFFMVGNPSETAEDVEKSMQLALKYPIRNANFYNVIPFPGTVLYEYVDKNNLWLKDKNTYLNTTAHFDDPIFETPEFPAAERKRMLRKTLACERIIRKRDTVRKLKKFGPFANIIASILFSNLLYDRIIDIQGKHLWIKKLFIYIGNKFNLGYSV